MAEIVPCPRCGKPMDFAATIGYYCGPECIPKLTTRPLMLPRLADRLRELIARHASLQRQTCTCKHCLYLDEAAAALDRTEALEQAAQEWAVTERAYQAGKIPLVDRHTATAALLAALSGGDPQ